MNSLNQGFVGGAVFTPHEVWAIKDYLKSVLIARRAIQLHPGPRQANYAWAVLLRSEQMFDRRLGTMAIEKHTGRDFQFDRWVNIRLTDPDKAELSRLFESIDLDALLGWVAAMTYDGYSFSVSWDDYSDSQQVSFVCKAVGNGNYGLGLSARHPDFDRALLTLRYKHEVCTVGDWVSAAPHPTPSWG